VRRRVCVVACIRNGQSASSNARRWRSGCRDGSSRHFRARAKPWPRGVVANSVTIDAARVVQRARPRSKVRDRVVNVFSQQAVDCRRYGEGDFPRGQDEIFIRCALARFGRRPVAMTATAFDRMAQKGNPLHQPSLLAQQLDCRLFRAGRDDIPHLSCRAAGRRRRRSAQPSEKHRYGID